MTQGRAEPTPVLQQAQDHPSQEGSFFYPLLGGKEETCPPNSPQCGTRFLFVPRQRRGGFRVGATPQTRTVPLGRVFSE